MFRRRGGGYHCNRDLGPGPSPQFSTPSGSRSIRHDGRDCGDGSYAEQRGIISSFGYRRRADRQPTAQAPQGHRDWFGRCQRPRRMVRRQERIRPSPSSLNGVHYVAANDGRIPNEVEVDLEFLTHERNPRTDGVPDRIGQ